MKNIQMNANTVKTHNYVKNVPWLDCFRYINNNTTHKSNKLYFYKQQYMRKSYYAYIVLKPPR